MSIEELNVMNRIQPKLKQLADQGRKALIPYVVAGDPATEITVPLLHALVAAGADMIELGVPFSDPMAEGPAIEAGHQRALAHHVNLTTVLDMVREFRQKDSQTPIVLMGYLNPFEKMGYQEFAQKAQQAGVDGVIVVDLPPEEASEWLQQLKQVQIDPIFLVAPTTTAERINMICQHASGYLYYVSLKGVTGSATLDVASVAQRLALLREHTTLPIAVGFGIQDAASAQAVAKVADAVIVGSALVKRIGALAQTPALICAQAPQLIKEMRAAMDTAS